MTRADWIVAEPMTAAEWERLWRGQAGIRARLYACTADYSRLGAQAQAERAAWRRLRAVAP